VSEKNEEKQAFYNGRFAKRASQRDYKVEITIYA
jgi:hypothetical protein